MQTNLKPTTMKAETKTKLLAGLEQWAVTFKLIGTMGESPRYSQILLKDGEPVLMSTQKNIFYNLGLTEQEKNELIDSIMNLKNELWEEWKTIRTEYLKSNHPTINPY